MNLNNHPTVQRVRLQTVSPISREREPLDAAWLRQIVLGAGADDVGFVEIGRPALDDQREDILQAFPHTQTLISIVCRMNREPIRSPARSVSNLEFHATYEHANEVARNVVAKLQAQGVRAMNPSAGFPMEMDRFPGKIWVVSHKPVAVAAGLGQIGIHRNVIHPVFGNFIVLDTILLDASVSAYGQPINYNPCLSCKLCVAACPVGAISPDGSFNFVNCSTHNYREFMGGFHDWIDTVTDSSGQLAYRNKVSDAETASIWQSLSFGPNYKAAYCLAVCPAGEEVIGPFLDDRKQFLTDTVRPLTEKQETIYVIADSDAERHVNRRFPHKTVKRVHSGVRPNSIDGFLRGMTLLFQPGCSEGLNAVYHFTFMGHEPRQATVVIRDQKVTVQDGHVGKHDLHVTADSQTWLGFLRRERSIVWALFRRKIRLAGPLKLRVAFGKCFPA